MIQLLLVAALAAIAGVVVFVWGRFYQQAVDDERTDRLFQADGGGGW